MGEMKTTPLATPKQLDYVITSVSLADTDQISIYKTYAVT
jgi:hypothetical protein|tara:strand:+ start:7131 stop:7250 length:120 start_codon:yes stop_codon:yes gene_type:complete